VPGEPVTPETTLAIIVGASKFPKSPKLAQGEAFAASASDFRNYLLDDEGFGLPQANLNDLFDSEDTPPELLEKMGEFLAAQKDKARDLVLYYLGHGGVSATNDFFLAVQYTKEGLEGPTGIRMADLATTVRRAAPLLRRFVILDCCFAAKAYKEWQSAPLEVVRAATQDFPQTGTSLLCSSSSRMVSLVKDNRTMFSGALLEVLRNGIPNVSRPLSLALVGKQVEQLIHRQYPDDAVRPEVLSPEQPDDDLKDLPLFPNVALRRRNFDCTVTISGHRNVTLEYAAENGKMQQVNSVLFDDPFALLAVKRLNDWVNIGVRLQQERVLKDPCSPEDLKVIGANLYRILFGEPSINEVFHALYRRFDERCHAEARRDPPSDLRLRLRLTFHRDADDEIARLPWEFLFVPGPQQEAKNGFFFAGDRTELILTRYVPVTARPEEAKSESLRIMVARYTSVEKNSITDEEWKILIENFNAITSNVTVVEDQPWDRLGDRLQQVKPHIFHFIGYGRFDESDKGGLALVGSPDDPDGQSIVPFTGNDLLSLFDYDPKPRLVFLHGCKGVLIDPPAAFRSQEALKSCARELAFAKIPAVVAMQYGIPHRELTAFATAMYEKLAEGKAIDEAVKAGRVKLGKSFRPIWGHPRFGTPLAYLQCDDPVVLPAPAGAQETREERETPVGGAAAVRQSSTRTSSAESAPAAADRGEREVSRFHE
jgi:hypothetical protein